MPGPALDGLDLSFLDRAPCKGLDPDLFFIDRGDNYGEARVVCNACPFAGLGGACIDYAARVLDPMSWSSFGLFGGFSPVERSKRKALREFRRARLPRPQGCGTDRGYHRHLERGEVACLSCRQAHSRESTDREARRRERSYPRDRGDRLGEAARPLLAARARAVGA